MNKVEKIEKLHEWMENRKLYSKICDDAISLLKKDLSVNCDHPEDFIASYRWEWDNGCGVQKNMEGDRCTICNKVKPWRSSSLWSEQSELL